MFSCLTGFDIWLNHHSIPSCPKISIRHIPSLQPGFHLTWSLGIKFTRYLNNLGTDYETLRKMNGWWLKSWFTWAGPSWSSSIYLLARSQFVGKCENPPSSTTTMRVSWRKSVNFGDKLARTLNAALADGGWIHLLDCNNNRSHPHGIQTINGLHLQNINNDFGKNSGGIIYQWSPPFTLQP